MEINEILSKCDHTLLSVNATEEDIKSICDDGLKYGTASVCIPTCYVKLAKEYTKGKLPICTVIGFPNGYSKTEVKIFEAEEAVLDGADEIDMVINIGMLKSGNFSSVLDEIKRVKAAVGDKILKVIIETCLLTESEKVKMCKIVSESGADFIKTSTGFSLSGATLQDIELMKKNVATNLKIKAAGGISSIADAENFINAGASRLGTSRIVKIIKNGKDNGGY